MNIVEPDIFRGMDEDEVRLHLMLEGWEPTKLIHTPTDYYEPHAHAEEKLLVILAGSMRLRVGREWTTLLPGDKAVVPPNMNHEAGMGKKGCTFFWAERLPEPDMTDEPETTEE